MTLHQELTDIIMKVDLERYGYADKDGASEAAGAVIEKIFGKLPERKKHHKGCNAHRPMFQFCSCGIDYWNQYHDTLKDLLTEEKQ